MTLRHDPEEGLNGSLECPKDVGEEAQRVFEGCLDIYKSGSVTKFKKCFFYFKLTAVDEESGVWDGGRGEVRMDV